MISDSLSKNANAKQTALLIVDMVTDFRFEDGSTLFNQSLKIVEDLSVLSRRLRALGAPIVYVNDGLGQGRERLTDDLQALESRSSEASEILSFIRPETDDHWIAKPQRSGFYGTPLGSLLMSLEVNSVVVAGLTTDICVLFTAHDAYMRGYSVSVPSDCSTAIEDSYHEEAISFMKRVAKADTRPSTSERWATVSQRAKSYKASTGSLAAPQSLVLTGAAAS